MCRKHPGVEPKTSNMSGICGGTSGSHRLTHDQYNDGKGAAYLRDKKQVKKKKGRINLFVKLTRLWLKFEKQHITETLALNVRNAFEHLRCKRIMSETLWGLQILLALYIFISV